MPDPKQPVPEPPDIDDYDTYDMAGATCPECGSIAISGFTNDLTKFQCNDCDAVFNITDD